MLDKRGEQTPSPDSGYAGSERPVDSSNRARFEEIALPHLDAVYRLARTLAATDAEADDLAQETFARALQAFDRFELRAYGAKPWLFRILQNTFYSLKGKQRRDPVLLDKEGIDQFASDDDGDDPELAGTLNWEQLDDEVKSAVERLQPEHRATLLLWSIEGLSYKEIAEICECPLGTVMSRLYRARRLLGRDLLSYAKERKLPTKRFE